MMNRERQAELLKYAMNTIKKEYLHQTLVPKPLKFNLTHHMDGLVARFTIEADGHQPMTIWQYRATPDELFEGINPDFEFALPKIEKFFRDLESTKAQIESLQKLEEMKRQAEENTRREAALACYEQMMRDEWGISG